MVLLFDMADHHGQKLTPIDVPFGRALSPGSRIVDMADRPASSERPDVDTALLEACRKGDLRRVESMWPLAKLPRETFKSVVRREGPDCVDGPPVPEFEQFENVLHAACAGGHLDVIKYLVEKQHMFLDTCDALGRSPLKIACDGGHTACAKVLGASYAPIVNLADRDGQTPFHVACSKGNVELIELLHRYGADLNTPSTQWLRHEDDRHWCKVRLTPFAAAVLSDSRPAVDCLLRFPSTDCETRVECTSCAEGFELGNCDLRCMDPLECRATGAIESKPKRQRRTTPVKDRAAKVGLALPPTPAGLRDRIAESTITDLRLARKEMQRHQKKCQQKTERAEMQQAKESAKYQRYCARSAVCVTRHRNKNSNKENRGLLL